MQSPSASVNAPKQFVDDCSLLEGRVGTFISHWMYVNQHHGYKKAIFIENWSKIVFSDETQPFLIRQE